MPNFRDSLPIRIDLIACGLLTLVAVGNVAWSIEPAQRDVVYATIDERPLLLDLYAPSNTTDSAPTIIWVHGGAWRSGSKSDVPVLHWLDQKLAIASVDYRLSPEAPFPAQVHDIKAAVRYLRSHANEFHLDPEHFIIAGSSAGAHLAALVGVSDGVKELEGEVGAHLNVESNVHGIVSFYGASNLHSILSQSNAHGLSVRVPALGLLLGGQPDEEPGLATLASPITHVDACDPPLWLVHGDADPQMPIEQSAELLTAYQKHHLEVSFDIISGGKHGGKEFFAPDRLDRIANELKN